MWQLVEYGTKHRVSFMKAGAVGIHTESAMTTMMCLATLRIDDTGKWLAPGVAVFEACCMENLAKQHKSHHHSSYHYR